MKMKNIMVLVKQSVYDDVKRLSKRTGNSFASIVRTAIDEYMHQPVRHPAEKKEL
jgi:predicted DNA-binding protein